MTILQIHLIDSYAPENLNSDRDGFPKDTRYGGAMRARISSQCANRAIRVSDEFLNAIQGAIAVRTKQLIPHLNEGPVGKGIDRQWAEQYAPRLVSGVPLGKKRGALYAQRASQEDREFETNVLLYISRSEIDELLDQLVAWGSQGESPDDAELKKWARDFSKRGAGRTSAADIALFGRMLADNPQQDIFAACSVDDAYSTHPVKTAEVDFFTAVDDWLPEGVKGASMMGQQYFNSATYYRYADIHWEQLLRNLEGKGDSPAEAVRAFLWAFALVAPSGKKKFVGIRHIPDFLLVVINPDNGAPTLDDAFEKPVRATEYSGYAEPSIMALCTFWDQYGVVVGDSSPVVFVLNPRGYELPSAELQAAQVKSLPELLDMTANQLCAL